MTTFLCKLKCGSEELDLFDVTFDRFAPLREGFEDAGDTVTLRLLLRGSTENAHQEVLRFIHKLSWFNERAVQYEQEHRGQPVYLGCKVYDGNAYDTLFGRGWLWKPLYGRHVREEPAIRYELAPNWPARIASGRANLEIVLRAKPRTSAAGKQCFVWEPLEDRWMGLASGAVRALKDGGVIIEEPTVNKLYNSDFEYESDPDNGWTPSGASLTVAINTDPAFVWHGYNSVLLSENGTADRYLRRTINVGNTNAHSLQAHVRKPDGGEVSIADCRLYYNSALSQTTYTEDPDRPGFYWLRAENFSGISSDVACGIYLEVGTKLYVDSFQLEEKAYCTSLAYGNMGRGYSFNDGAHLSESIRAGATLAYRNTDSTPGVMMPKDTMTCLIVWKVPRDYDDMPGGPPGQYHILLNDEDNFAQFRYDGTNQKFQMNQSSEWAEASNPDFSAGDIVFCFFRWGPGGLLLNVYREDGSLMTTGSTGSNDPTDLGDYVYLGSYKDNQYHAGGQILEVQIWNEEKTPVQMQERVKAGYGSAELPFLWSNDGAGGVRNIHDPGDSYYNWVEFDNLPGDEDAAAKVLVQQATSGQTPMYFYTGLMRRAVVRSDLPAHWLKVGCQWRAPFIQAEAGSGSYDTDTTTQTVSGASGGATNNCARTTPTSTANVKRIEIPICDEEDLWKWLGTYRVIGRFKTSSTDHFKVQYRIVTGYHAGPFTPQFYASGDDVWQPGEHHEQIVDIPSHYIEPGSEQSYRPGAWTGSSTYCRLELWVEAESASGNLYTDGILLIPNDAEGFGAMGSGSDWPYQRVLLLDSCSRERMSAVVHDADFERLHSGFDWSGCLFTLPIGGPSIMVFAHRRSGSGYEWVKTDQMTVWAKYRGRYLAVR